MRTYPDEGTKLDYTVGFEIDNVYVSLSKVASILSSINGVTQVKRRRLFSKWQDIHIWFNYKGHKCVVIEPFGDNSHYWIGLENSTLKLNLNDVERAFNQYQPPLLIKVFGDILMLNFKSLLNVFKTRR